MWLFVNHTARETLYDIQVAIVAGFHLFPFRTEKLSPFTPMVLRKWESRSLPFLREAFQFLKAEMLLFLCLLPIRTAATYSLNPLAQYLDLVLVPHSRDGASGRVGSLFLVYSVNALTTFAWWPYGTVLARGLARPNTFTQA